MAPHGGFDHNAQALKIVTSLERSYAGFDGLNLTWETLEGIAKHNGPVTGALPFALADYNARHDLELHTHASGEAQVAAVSDDVAYNNHDLADGLRAGLFTDAEAADLPIVGPAYAEVDRICPGLDPKRRRAEALRRVFGVMVSDVIDESRARLAEAAPADVAALRGAGRPMVRFSHGLFTQLKEIRAFLFSRMYRAPSVVEMRKRVTCVVEELFPLYMARPDLLPEEWQSDVAQAGDETARARLVADYIAGMTDRFALQQHRDHVAR
jgi:dGTPase